MPSILDVPSGNISDTTLGMLMDLGFAEVEHEPDWSGCKDEERKGKAYDHIQKTEKESIYVEDIDVTSRLNGSSGMPMPWLYIITSQKLAILGSWHYILQVQQLAGRYMYSLINYEK